MTLKELFQHSSRESSDFQVGICTYILMDYRKYLLFYCGLLHSTLQMLLFVCLCFQIEGKTLHQQEDHGSLHQDTFLWCSRTKPTISPSYACLVF